MSVNKPAVLRQLSHRDGYPSAHARRIRLLLWSFPGPQRPIRSRMVTILSPRIANDRLTRRNYVIQGIAFVCFELTAFNVLVSYWAPNLNPAICISAGLVALGLANGINVRLYGEIGASQVPLSDDLG